MHIFARDKGADPWRRTTSPQLTSRSIALRIVIRATPNSSPVFLSRQRAADIEIGGIQPQPQSVSDGFVDHQ
jgi:hypothetical protein